MDTDASEEAAVSFLTIFRVGSEAEGSRLIQNSGDYLQTTRCHTDYCFSPNDSLAFLLLSIATALSSDLRKL
jgi:hypothetical protein